MLKINNKKFYIDVVNGCFYRFHAFSYCYDLSELNPKLLLVKMEQDRKSALKKKVKLITTVYE